MSWFAWILLLFLTVDKTCAKHVPKYAFSVKMMRDKNQVEPASRPDRQKASKQAKLHNYHWPLFSSTSFRLQSTRRSIPSASSAPSRLLRLRRMRQKLEIKHVSLPLAGWSARKGSWNCWALKRAQSLPGTPAAKKKKLKRREKKLQ